MVPHGPNGCGHRHIWDMSPLARLSARIFFNFVFLNAIFNTKMCIYMVMWVYLIVKQNMIYTINSRISLLARSVNSRSTGDLPRRRTDLRPSLSTNSASSRVRLKSSPNAKKTLSER